MNPLLVALLSNPELIAAAGALGFAILKFATGELKNRIPDQAKAPMAAALGVILAEMAGADLVAAETVADGVVNTAKGGLIALGGVKIRDIISGVKGTK